MRSTAACLLLLCGSLSGCANSNVGPNLAVGPAAYDLMPAPVGEPSAQDYRIGPLDTLRIGVFQEPDISSDAIVVDAAGNIAMPLIGRVPAAGRTSTELADILARLLAERFYVDPQVTVTVSSSVAQRVTVQGEVEAPGIYPISGPTTLLDAVALARGETANAALREIIVVRYIDGQRMGAVFDLKQIRRGDIQDPAILPRDVIIVGHSTGKQIWHDLLLAAPLANVFAQF